ncbi:MAG: hypothetical protein MZV65_30555 [Chromatiales bacterium]|nr:hypothetical protein [Chromatiales bacterium]
MFTVGYSPIEQYLVESKGYGPWTDVYAVGAVLYQCVTGTAAGRGAGPGARRSAAARRGGRWPDEYSPALLRLIDRAMAVRPEKRFQNRSRRCGRR